MGGTRAYIGSFTTAGGRGITAATVDPESGELTVLGAAHALENPSFLVPSPDGDLLYAVGESEAGLAAAFRTTGTPDGVPVPIRAPVPVGGAGPTHLALADRHLVVANYGSGSVSTLPLLPDGAPGGGAVLQHTGSGPDPERQEGPHAHQVVPDPSGRWILSVDLGTDSVRVCAFEDDALVVRRETALRPGSGPRHLAFHPDGRFVHVLNELAPTVTVCHWDRDTGALTPREEIPVQAPGSTGDAYPSGIVVDPRGRFVWTAIRGQDAIAVLSVEDGGAALRLTATVDCGGHWPRDLALHPSGRFLYAANERSGDVTWFTLDPETGVPARGGAIDAPAASCVVFG
ncbi:6-phosphogluconolactonase [Streptomyces sp. YIM 130001]|uniref:lactonase family protein n=1 Tax=Streptomyces sp. YIM 130001 TaxID=2259644 RepID=UPI000ED0CB7C|nr:lactonase family protein [Streptomyces sp. YIM 130001]RII09332.1 6-phosphogluconolactonase [Streptomyces sp. YIM 130001]